MTVFTLELYVPYEGSELLGIYATLERAEAARDAELAERIANDEWNEAYGEEFIIREEEIQ